MNFHDVKALTFDTGGTILDWHTGFRSALEKLGKKYGLMVNSGHLSLGVKLCWCLQRHKTVRALL